MNHTFVLRTPLDADGFQMEGLTRVPFSEGLLRTARSSAVLESKIIRPPEPFDDLVGSWNAVLPAGARVEMQVQVSSGPDWSTWYSLGTAIGQSKKHLEMGSPASQEDSRGLVDVDTLKLKSPAEALRYRLIFSAPDRPILLRLAAVTVSDSWAPVEPPPWRPDSWSPEVKVRGRSQMIESSDYKHDICSPTALAAVLERWGVNRRTLDIAERVRDQTTGDFGDWAFNAAAAGALGFEAYVSRLNSLDDLAEEIALGRPIVVSVTFGAGELAGSPIKASRGHLLVVTGFTREGDVLVMDPAGPSDKKTRRIYDRGQFHRAWRVNKRGLAYLVGPLFDDRRLTVGVPVADLWASPRRESKAKPALDDRGHLTQLLYGESVTVQRARGDWVQVLADEQDHLVRGSWQGYPGWLRADQLTAALPSTPNAVVRTRQAILHKEDGLLVLSVGTRLSRQGSRVRLLDGSQAQASEDALIVLEAVPNESCRPLILKTAELFLGTSYYWGGRSGVQPDHTWGVDCSGLVNLAYHVCGIDTPRDADKQRAKSRPIARQDLRPGDLVFLTEKPRSKKVDHVFIYTGGDGLIESCPDRVTRTTFAERFGVKLDQIEAGQIVTTALPKPRQRKIFFGSYF